MNDKKKKGGKGKLLLILLIVLIVVLAAAGGGYFALHKMQQSGGQETVAAKPVPPPAPVFFPMDTFTVNLVNQDNDLDRVLYIGFTLRLPDEETRQRLSDYLPEVRSRLLLLLSRQNVTTLNTEQGKQALINDIKTTLAPPLVTGQPPQVINDVLFTAFILR